MKKILICMAALLMISLVAVANNREVFAPPCESDIGCNLQTEVSAVIAMDGISFAVSNYQIVEWQTPVMLNMESETSAQVIDHLYALTPKGKLEVSLVCYRWPYPFANARTDTTTLQMNFG